MTHPLTPREKVARAIQAHDNDHVPDGYANGLSDEVSDWSAYLADRVLTALASGSGDHAELARLAEAANSIGGDWECTTDEGSAFIAAANPATVLALLGENAALRAGRTFLIEQKEGAEDALFDGMSRVTEAERALAEHRITADLLVSSLKSALTEAERKLAEAMGLLRDAIAEHSHMTDVEAFEELGNVAATELIAVRTFLSKEAERG